ncbi:GNAT family N-acetyltransferase [Sulfitobacter sp. S190]|uniref:GNAT family N-acetyltransferase n=1 Tax=Sulfitobacter sp. S190 TaxID=2867022 RepID=UPI0021A420C1|nr:GNAT family N-acetyltransferase [Sulfitobacter sp. S190]UWR21516.1 GNAT family N-acetyltransferase [Sulfitobacter sp. S190]
MILRAATPADLPAIGALWNAMIRDTTATFTTREKTPQDLQDLLENRPAALIVAQTAQTAQKMPSIAGFVTWGPFRSGPGYAHTVEHTIITATPGKGVGRALLQRGLADAAQQGAHVAVAAISGENQPAVAFHTRMGFAKAGHMREVGRKEGRWLDLILMTKHL